MNQQTPLQTPPKQTPQPKPETAPRKDNTFLAKLLLVLLAVSAAAIIGCVIMISVALPRMDEGGKNSDDPSDLPTNGEASQPENDRGAVATQPDRPDYNILDAESYVTVKGVSSKYAVLVDLENSYEIYRDCHKDMTFDIHTRSIR